MASAGKRNTLSGHVKVWWRLDDGSQGSQTFDDDDQATRYLNKLRAQWDDGTWINPQRGRISFNEWADEWWETWSTHPRRSPNGLETTESSLRLHLRPTFGPKPLNVISHQLVQRWQNQLEGKLGHSGVTACRSLLNRILQAAHDDNRIPNNPVRRVGTLARRSRRVPGPPRRAARSWPVRASGLPPDAVRDHTLGLIDDLFDALGLATAPVVDRSLGGMSRSGTRLPGRHGLRHWSLSATRSRCPVRRSGCRCGSCRLGAR